MLKRVASGLVFGVCCPTKSASAVSALPASTSPSTPGERRQKAAFAAVRLWIALQRRAGRGATRSAAPPPPAPSGSLGAPEIVCGRAHARRSRPRRLASTPENVRRTAPAGRTTKLRVLRFRHEKCTPSRRLLLTTDAA
jgi:hypothetical protein